VERRSGGGSPVLEHLLDEQVAYYRALGADYLDQGLDLPGGGELTDALNAFQPRGSVLELACGPGVWTGQLLRYATDVTEVDASPEMLAIAATPDELVEGPSSWTIRRKIPDGTAYRIVKVPHQPGDLERLLQQLGWDIKVTATAGPCYWGAGSLA
jgi:SAM-dependent methyltransferase